LSVFCWKNQCSGNTNTSIFLLYIFASHLSYSYNFVVTLIMYDDFSGVFKTDLIIGIHKKVNFLLSCIQYILFDFKSQLIIYPIFYRIKIIYFYQLIILFLRFYPLFFLLTRKFSFFLIQLHSLLRGPLDLLRL